MYETKIEPTGNGAYNLYVDGRLYIREETFTVCDQVAEHVKHPYQCPYSETVEILDSIRKNRGMPPLRFGRNPAGNVLGFTKD